MPLKPSVDDLALFGGEPVYPEPLHVGRPNYGDPEALHRRLEGILGRRWLTNDGPLVQELESQLTESIGVRHVVAVVSGTVGLEVLARALGLRGEVIVPSFTFVGTAHALSWLGLRPVFCDIDPKTMTIDPAMVERLITPATSAILGVHLWGRICETEVLERLGERVGVPVIYDAAHAFACSRGGRMAGSFGAAEVLSFHATKVINTFEGGAICTDDDELAARARLMINFGYDDWDSSVEIGTNGKMHEMSAAMGLTSLEAAAEIIATNQRNLSLYSRNLSGIDGIRLMDDTPRSETNAHYVVIRVGPDASLTRDGLQQVLVAEGVLARRYFHPGCHRTKPYAVRGAAASLPVTEALADEVLVLPTGTAIDGHTIEGVCDLIRFALENGERIRQRLVAS